MYTQPSMLLEAAKAVGMKCPAGQQQADEEEQLSSEYPHWKLFCLTNLNRPLQREELFRNADRIMMLTSLRCQTITLRECAEIGFYKLS